MKVVKTKYGMVHGITQYETYPSGRIKSVVVNEKNELSTSVGKLIPQYLESEGSQERIKKVGSSVKFFEEGRLKSVALESKTSITSPMGPMDAELVTFYETGELHRIFPLNGQINGYWSEEDEKETALSYNINLGFSSFEAKLVGLRFYQSGALRSLTLWPGEVVVINTPLGEIATRVGISLYEEGSLHSIEPAYPQYISTPIGLIQPYDEWAVGVHGDHNSLVFTKIGMLASLKTMKNGVVVTGGNNKRKIIEPQERVSLLDGENMEVIPLSITFKMDMVILDDGQEIYEFSRDEYQFRVFEAEQLSQNCSGGCSSCSGCH